MKHIYDNQNGNQNSNNKSVEERFTERFKNLANSYEPTFEPTFEPADWSAMQSKLDAHNEKDRKRVIFRRLATLATMSAAAMLLLFGGYQFLNNSTDIISKQSSNQNISFQENSIKKSTPSTNPSSSEKTLTQNDLKENLDKDTKNLTKTKSSFDSKSKVEKSNQNSQIAQTNSVSNSLSNFTSDYGNNQLVFSTSKEQINLTNDLQESNRIEQVESNQMLSSLRLEKIKFDLFANIKPKEITLPALKIDELLLASANQNEELIRKNPVVSAIGKWRFGAVLMAMTNIYKSNDKQRMNYANGYGLMADYQVAKRLNISAGAIYTQKRIDLEEPLSITDITNSFNPTTNDDAWVKKNKTQINWQLLDLPIHLRYNAIETDRNKWFVSAGTSNYFFLKENYESDYTVSYQNIYDPRLTRTQEIVRQRETQSAIQLFATINVSVGLETSLGKHLTLQVEPYWKFPVRSLGSEGVFVQTGGLLTRINFAL
jgi:hypothetical protein